MACSPNVAVNDSPPGAVTSIVGPRQRICVAAWFQAKGAVSSAPVGNRTSKRPEPPHHSLPNNSCPWPSTNVRETPNFRWICIS